MNDPIDYILASLRRAADNAYPWSLTPHEAGVVVAEIERMRAERHMDNADLAQAYDFARNKGEALERQAVVAWLRRASALRHYAGCIERGEHRVVEGEVEDETEAEQKLRAEAFGADRPEWVVCVTRSGFDSWCGQKVSSFMFTGWDHASVNAVNEGRLTTCPGCVRGLITVLARQGMEWQAHEDKDAEIERLRQACIAYIATISAIDYACGEPNEMRCSDFDVHGNEEAVVERVREMVRRIHDLEEHIELIKRAWRNVEELKCLRVRLDQLDVRINRLDAPFKETVGPNALGAEVERLRAEVEWLRSPVLHTEPCANCGHTKFHHHGYRDRETANDRTRCWGAGFDRDDCAARCEGFVRFTHDARKP